MTDRERTHLTLDEGRAELDAIRRELLMRVDAEPENGELRRDAFEVSGLAERVEWLLETASEGASPHQLYTGDLDLALLDKHADEADAPSPYRGVAAPEGRSHRADRLRALRALLSMHNYGDDPPLG
jgi:hypothetical protein